MNWTDLQLMIEGGGNMMVPTISKSDFAYHEANPADRMLKRIMGGGDSGTWEEEYVNPNYRSSGYYLTPEAKARLGQWAKNDTTSIAWGNPTVEGTGQGFSSDGFFSFGDGYAPGYMAGPGDNQQLVGASEGGGRAAADEAFNRFWNQDSIAAAVKSADKQGTGVQWVREGDSFVPKRTTGSFGWDTNPGEMNRMLAMSIAALGGVGMLGNLAMTGNALTAAGGAGSAAGAGAGTAAGGAGLFDGAALGGLGGVEPIATSGFTAAQGGIGSLGAGWGLPGGVVAGEAGGGILGLSNMVGIGGGMFDGLGSLGDIIKSGGGDLLKKYGGDLLGGLVETGIGRAGDRQQRINSQDYRDLQINTGAQLRGAAGNYASGLGGLFDKYKGAYDPFYAQVNNGIGTSNIDPVTGKVGFSLNAPYQQQRDSLFGAAGDVMGQMRSFDPRAHAAERYQSAQGLLAEGDARNQQSLMQDLYTKGGFGLTTNQPAAARPGEQIGTVVPGQGSVGVNPYVDTFLNAQNRRNAGMSYDALREGEGQLDNLIRRQQGLFGAGQAIDTAGYGAVRDAGAWSDQFMGDRRQAAGFGYGAEREALGIPYQAEKDYINALFGANQGFMGREAAADQTKQNSYWDTASKLPWGSVWDSISGLFGSKR